MPSFSSRPRLSCRIGLQRRAPADQSGSRKLVWPSRLVFACAARVELCGAGEGEHAGLRRLGAHCGSAVWRAIVEADDRVISQEWCAEPALSWSSVKNSSAIVWQGLKVGSAYSFSPAFEAYSAKSLRFRALAYEPSSVSMRFMVACSSA